MKIVLRITYYALVFNNFKTEFKKATILIKDLKFAYNITKANDSNIIAFEELRIEEIESIKDRDLVLSFNKDGDQLSPDINNLLRMSRIEAAYLL